MNYYHVLWADGTATWETGDNLIDVNMLEPLRQEPIWEPS